MIPSYRRECGGQILVVALLGSALLAGLVFYVANVGDQVNRRVAMQNAADATAISGASWMARSMNLVAENNVAQTRMLALVPVLDAFPLATKMAYEETDAWVRCLEGQLSRSLQADPTGPRLLSGLQKLRDRIARQRDVLAPLNAYFNPNGNVGAPITPVTTWSIPGYAGPPPNGSLWQAAQTMDDLSQATCLSASVLTQSDAVRWGTASGAETAFVVPVLPTLPGQRTSFADFERPVRQGRIPDHVDHKRLGPYDRLFKWRHYNYRNITEPDHMVPGQQGHGPIRGGGGHAPGGDRSRGRSARGYTTNPNDQWTYRTIGQVLLGYTVYGPYQWMMSRVHGYAQGWWQDRGYYAGELADTFFHEYHGRIADIKLKYMWQSNPPLQGIHYPNYVPDYQEAKNYVAAHPGAKVVKTMFYRVEIRSRYLKTDPGFLSAGSYVTNDDLPIAMWIKGWQDPETWNNIVRIANYVWEDQYFYETTEDWDIGLRRTPDPNNPGQNLWQPVYMIAQYVFGGIDIGPDVPVSNPANCGDRNALPAPVLMDTAVGDYDLSQPSHDLGVRREVFTYLGVAKQKNDPLIWAPRFGSGNPYRGVAAVSQVEIFNTRSWDLWTQDWKVKLVPVTGWREWNDRMVDGIGEAHSTQGMVNPDIVQELQEYFGRFSDEMAAEMMNH